MDVSSSASLNRVDGVQGDYSKPIPVEVVPVAEAPITQVLVAPLPVVEKVKEVPVVFSLPLVVSLGDAKPRVEDVSVQFMAVQSSREKILHRAVSGGVPSVGALPPLAPSIDLPRELALGVSSGLKKDDSVPARSLLLSRDGELLSGSGEMMDYMISRALPARPVVAATEDSFVGSLGAPGDRQVSADEQMRKVSTEVVGDMSLGAAFGVRPTVSVGSDMEGMTSFEPLPPQAYKKNPDTGVYDASTSGPTGDYRSGISGGGPMISGQTW